MCRKIKFYLHWTENLYGKQVAVRCVHLDQYAKCIQLIRRFTSVAVFNATRRYSTNVNWDVQEHCHFKRIQCGSKKPRDKCLGDNDVLPIHDVPLLHQLQQSNVTCSHVRLLDTTALVVCRRGHWHKSQRGDDKSEGLGGQAQQLQPTDRQRSYRWKWIIHRDLVLALMESEEKGRKWSQQKYRKVTSQENAVLLHV